ncbi:hypothetical protein ACJX0J_034196, partial [Zea mays]
EVSKGLCKGQSNLEKLNFLLYIGFNKFQMQIILTIKFQLLGLYLVQNPRKNLEKSSTIDCIVYMGVLLTLAVVATKVDQRISLKDYNTINIHLLVEIIDPDHEWIHVLKYECSLASQLRTHSWMASKPNEQNENLFKINRATVAFNRAAKDAFLGGANTTCGGIVVVFTMIDWAYMQEVDGHINYLVMSGDEHLQNLRVVIDALAKC